MIARENRDEIGQIFIIHSCYRSPKMIAWSVICKSAIKKKEIFLIFTRTHTHTQTDEDTAMIDSSDVSFGILLLL